MIVKIADNITSPLGLTTAENLHAVHLYHSALSLHQMWDIPDSFMASLFGDCEVQEITYEGLLRHSIEDALRSLQPDAELPVSAVDMHRTLLLLSSTKGQTTGINGEPMGVTAQRLAHHFGIETLPITVSNACISGLAAQILAMRLLEMGRYDIAIVAGCDVLTKFVVSGFQSFHALSDEQCRPFDENRFGLNLGEAAATMILARSGHVDPEQWAIVRGAVCNDAFHISSPSKIAEGYYRALNAVIKGEDKNKLACISAHGTATLYNDDMESRGIYRAGMNDVLVSGLKGYFGHTMGAAGLLETILTMHAIDEGWVPGTRGYSVCGTTFELRVSAQHQPTVQRQFVKLMSGFGGCNAAA